MPFPPLALIRCLGDCVTLASTEPGEEGDRSEHLTREEFDPKPQERTVAPGAVPCSGLTCSQETKGDAAEEAGSPGRVRRDGSKHLCTQGAGLLG